MIASDLKSEREPFVQLFETARRVGRCSPSKFTDRGAVQVIHVSVNATEPEMSAAFVIFKDQTGRWLCEGHGASELVDSGADFTEYRFERAAVEEVKAWYEKHIPEADRKR